MYDVSVIVDGNVTKYIRWRIIMRKVLSLGGTAQQVKFVEAAKGMEAGLAKCFHTVEAFMNNESLAHSRKKI